MENENLKDLGEELTDEALDETSGGGVRLQQGGSWVRVQCSNPTCGVMFWKLSTDANTLCSTCRRTPSDLVGRQGTPPPAVSL